MARTSLMPVAKSSKPPRATNDVNNKKADGERGDEEGEEEDDEEEEEDENMSAWVPFRVCVWCYLITLAYLAVASLLLFGLANAFSKAYTPIVQSYQSLTGTYASHSSSLAIPAPNPEVYVVA